MELLLRLELVLVFLLFCRLSLYGRMILLFFWTWWILRNQAWLSIGQKDISKLWWMMCRCIGCASYIVPWGSSCVLRLGPFLFPSLDSTTAVLVSVAVALIILAFVHTLVSFEIFSYEWFILFRPLGALVPLWFTSVFSEVLIQSSGVLHGCTDLYLEHLGISIIFGKGYVAQGWAGFISMLKVIPDSTINNYYRTIIRWGRSIHLLKS